jgi:hypothetical protein
MFSPFELDFSVSKLFFFVTVTLLIMTKQIYHNLNLNLSDNKMNFTIFQCGKFIVKKKINVFPTKKNKSQIKGLFLPPPFLAIFSG